MLSLGIEDPLGEDLGQTEQTMCVTDGSPDLKLPYLMSTALSKCLPRQVIQLRCRITRLVIPGLQQELTWSRTSAGRTNHKHT